MKICIPTMDDSGLTGLPHDHFGSAPYFTFIDTETMDVEAVRNGGASHVHGACRPLEFLGARPVDAVVCRGLGKRAFARLRNAGIDVFVTLEPNVENTLSALRDGRLRRMTDEGVCHGHGHGHGHGHEQGRGHGPGHPHRRNRDPGSSL